MGGRVNLFGWLVGCNQWRKGTSCSVQAGGHQNNLHHLSHGQWGAWKRARGPLGKSFPWICPTWPSSSSQKYWSLVVLSSFLSECNCCGVNDINLPVQQPPTVDSMKGMSPCGISLDVHFQTNYDYIFQFQILAQFVYAVRYHVEDILHDPPGSLQE